MQVYDYSKLEEGILNITLLYTNASGEEVTWEMKGVIDVHHKKAIHLLWEVFDRLLEMALSSDSPPFARLLY